MITDSRIYHVIINPINTEKSNAAMQRNTIVFKVALDATKEEIKAAVKKLLNVEQVKSVRTLIVKGKTRRTAHGIGRRSDWKKAYVTLPEGVKIPDTTALEQTAEKESK
ncbi:MAG: 50S ribosomal protein L23 [Succinivibrio sp.]